MLNRLTQDFPPPNGPILFDGATLVGYCCLTLIYLPHMLLAYLYTIICRRISSEKIILFALSNQYRSGKENKISVQNKILTLKEPSLIRYNRANNPVRERTKNVTSIVIPVSVDRKPKALK